MVYGRYGQKRSGRVSGAMRTAGSGLARSMLRALMPVLLPILLVVLLLILPWRAADAQDWTTPDIYIAGPENPPQGLIGQAVPPSAAPTYWMLRLTFRTPPRIGQQPPKPLYVKAMRLKSLIVGHKVWDTVPFSPKPLLLVSRSGAVLNRGDRSIAGMVIDRSMSLELFVADDGFISARPNNLVLEIETLDGPVQIAVDPAELRGNDFDRRQTLR